jgi:hypothetical protein
MASMIRVSGSVIMDTFDAHEKYSEGTDDEWEVCTAFIKTREFEGCEDFFHKFGGDLLEDGAKLAADEARCYIRVMNVWKMIVDDCLRVVVG